MVPSNFNVNSTACHLNCRLLVHTFIHCILYVSLQMRDLILFMVIFCIFVFAFGTIELAVTSPRTPFSKALLFNITYRAYFQVYGELFLDDFRSEGGM